MSVPYRLPRSGPLVVFDTEFTAWEGSLERGWSGPGEHREIVQIGAVRLDCGRAFKECESLSILVRPSRNPVVSDYFHALTGIDQARLDIEGMAFSKAYEIFLDMVAGAPLLSWGWDDSVFRENLVLNELPENTWPENFTNLRQVTIANHGDRFRECSSATLPALFGLAPAGNAHDALEDARAVARALPAMVAAGFL